jgi:hypothetical protein
MINMYHENKAPSCGRRGRDAFLAKAAGLWPVAKGSLTQMRSPCTRKNCKEYASGRKHPKLIFTFREEGRLREDVARLKAKLSRQERSAREEPFGLSTPSSRRLVKPSLPELTEEEARRRKGGAPAGRAGHGWKTPGAAEPGIEELPAPDACPCCCGRWRTSRARPKTSAT